MIGRIFRWNRLVLPPWWAISSFLLIYLIAESLCLYVGWWLDLPGDAKQFVETRWVVVGTGAVVFAMFRVGFHPVHRPEYRAWLACTPWTAAKPLPLGPVHLIPQDGVILALLLLMLGTAGPELVLVAFAFLFAYQPRNGSHSAPYRRPLDSVRPAVMPLRRPKALAGRSIGTRLSAAHLPADLPGSLATFRPFSLVPERSAARRSRKRPDRAAVVAVRAKASAWLSFPVPCAETECPGDQPGRRHGAQPARGSLGPCVGCEWTRRRIANPDLGPCLSLSGRNRDRDPPCALLRQLLASDQPLGPLRNRSLRDLTL